MKLRVVNVQHMKFWRTHSNHSTVKLCECVYCCVFVKGNKIQQTIHWPCVIELRETIHGTHVPNWRRAVNWPSQLFHSPSQQLSRPSVFPKWYLHQDGALSLSWSCVSAYHSLELVTSARVHFYNVESIRFLSYLIPREIQAILIYKQINVHFARMKLNTAFARFQKRLVIKTRFRSTVLKEK